VLLALKMVPAQVMTECRAKAELAVDENRPQYRWMAAVIAVVWIVVLLAVGVVAYKLWKPISK
jgi:tryptophan-rich sensory protein